MIHIAHYHRKTLRLRREKGLRVLDDENDIPDDPHNPAAEPKIRSAQDAMKLKTVASKGGSSPGSDDLEAGSAPRGLTPDGDEAVLTDEQQAKYLYHQTKFCRSHTFYKPHETLTHKAFRLDLLIVIVCLLDCHSLFQVIPSSLSNSFWLILHCYFLLQVAYSLCPHLTPLTVCFRSHSEAPHGRLTIITDRRLSLQSSSPAQYAVILQRD